MTGTHYQALAMRTNKPCENQIINAVLGLTGEAGECADMVKKHIFQGHEFHAIDFVKELGDVMWYVALACETLGITMDDVMKMNIEKLQARYPEGFSEEASIHRKE